MKFRPFILLCCLACIFPFARAAGANQPNIVFILADDLGWTDVAFQGSKYYETPHIDRLAQNGMRFSNFCVSQNCAPTRACLMSGQYAPRTGIYTVGSLERGKAEDRAMNVPRNETDLPLEIQTIANVLQSAGYATGMFGKWHLGNDRNHHPSKRGFDEAVVSTGHAHFKFKTIPNQEIQPQTYLADYLTDLSLQFIDAHRQKPFFLYLPHFGVHSPYQAKKTWIDRFQKMAPVGQHRDPTYAAMIASIDESVGRVMDKLASAGLDDRTVVIFASDNGGVGGYDTTEPPSSKRGITDNAPLRGGKGTLYEGGLRVPFVVRWPGVIIGGSVCDEPAAHVDIFPTLAEIAGAELPQNQPVDGMSLVPLLRNSASTLNREALFWHFPGYLESYVHRRGWRTSPVSVVRAGPWKLMEFLEDDRLELYHLRDDPSETVNLVETQPARRDRLYRQLRAWRESVGAAMPSKKSL